MKYELTIDATYLDDKRWGVGAGIREFLQNGRDAEIEQQAPLTVTHYNNTLRIENEGAVLSRDALLLGRSTKRDRQDVLAGKWGEGLKLGALALVRAGYPVTIRNGGEVWKPSIEASEKFEGREVLVFNVTTGREERNRVRVEIGNVTKEDWSAVKDHFLFLDKREMNVVKTSEGALLRDPRFQGRIYVKGIFVQHDVSYSYGYDLFDAEVDRDRRIIASWDLQARLRRIWGEALASHPDLLDEFYKLLDKNADDTKGVDKWSADSVPEAAAARIVEKFKETHGLNAVPVSNLSDSRDMEHLGKKGIVVSSGLGAVLGRLLGDAEAVKKSLREEVTRIWSWSDLDATEKSNLETAIGLVNPSARIDFLDIDVVDFRSAALYGQFKDGRQLLARSVLASRQETLATLVHEVAHRTGGDGDKSHVAEIERIWAEIVEKLRGV
jgi:hypothetical protein